MAPAFTDARTKRDRRLIPAAGSSGSTGEPALGGDDVRRLSRRLQPEEPRRSAGRIHAAPSFAARSIAARPTLMPMLIAGCGTPANLDRKDRDMGP